MYEGPKLTSAQQGFGQGWTSAIKFGDDVTEDVLREEPDIATAADGTSVFVVHGRDAQLRDQVFVFLLALGLRPLEWPRLVAAADDASPWIGDVITQLANAAAVVVLLTPDDVAKLRDDLADDADPRYERELTGQPRQNVIFEAGMALALAADKTVLVEVGSTRPFSDIVGRWVLRLRDDQTSVVALAERLRSIGCSVDTSGELWLKHGRFVGYATDGGMGEQTLSVQRLRRIANVLAAELEEAMDLIGTALETDRLWPSPRRIPTNAANAHLDDLASVHGDVHKAVRDAYRKINDLNWLQISRSAAEEPGAILAPGESLELTVEDRSHLAGVQGVVRNALDVLRTLSAR